MTNWNDTTERYIAFIDIMGFSNYVYRNRHDIVKKRMMMLQSILDETEKEIHEVSKELENIDNPIKSVIFSDSILLITKDNTENSMNMILFTCQLLLSKSFKSKIPMKGAISYGTITADFTKSLFFGKGLIDAYKLQEQLFIYGIVLDEKVEKKVKKRKDYLEAYCYQTKTPTKSGNITHYTINWMLWTGLKIEKNKTHTVDYDLAISVMEAFYSDMSGYPRKYIDNTLEYFPKTSS